MTQVAQNQPQAKDFVIKPPTTPSQQPAAPQPTAQPQQSAPQTAQQPAGATPLTATPVQPVTDRSGAHSLSNNDLVIAVAALLFAAVMFFFLRGAVRSSLINHKASPSAAGSTGWALFVFLLCTAGTLIFGFLGNFWLTWQFIAPMGAIVFVTLILFIILYSKAAKGQR